MPRISYGREAFSGPTPFDTIARSAQSKYNQELGRLMGYEDRRGGRGSSPRPGRMTSQQYEDMLYGLAGGAPTADQLMPLMVQNPHTPQPENPSVIPSNLNMQESRIDLPSGLGMSVSEEFVAPNVPRGMTAQEEQAVRAKSILQQRDEAAMRKQERELMQEYRKKAIDHVFDPNVNLTAEAREEISQQLISRWGPDAALPDPATLFQNYTEQDDPMVAKSNAIERLRESDSHFKEGYEHYISVGEDGQLNMGAYNDRIKLDIEQQKSRDAMVRDMLKTEQKRLQEQFMTPISPSLGAAGAERAKQEQIRAYNEEWKRVRKEIVEQVGGYATPEFGELPEGDVASTQKPQLQQGSMPNITSASQVQSMDVGATGIYNGRQVWKHKNGQLKFYPPDR